MTNPNSPDVKDAVRSFIVSRFLFGQGTVSNDASFLDGGIVDSTGVLELVFHLESTYSIKVEDNELVPENLDSIDNIAAFLNRKVGRFSAHQAPPSGTQI